MEVRKGYKKTEVGIIPEDWELIPFDKIFSFHSTSNYSKAQMSEENEVGCIHYGLIHAISNTQYNLKNGIKFYITSEQAKYEYVRDGDVIMVDASEDFEGVNKSVEVYGINDKKYISGLHTYLLRDKNTVLADNFRGILLNSKLVKNQMLSLAVGMKVFGVSKTQLVKVKLPLPPTIEEQKAIAEALSDIDELIEALDKLIEKKEYIKKGAMQELLTGKRRLPGFAGKWEEKRLGDLGFTYNGLTGKTKVDFEDGNSCYIPFLNVLNNTFIRTSNLEKVMIKSGEIQNKVSMGDLLFNTSSESPEEVGMASVLQESFENLYLNSFCFGYRIIDQTSVNSPFLSYLFRSSVGRRIMTSLAQGSTRYNLSKTKLLKVSIRLPEIQEQKAIAGVLTNMDEEIEKLKIKREKTKQIKEGMMQELLTGKTRLV